MLKVRLFHNGPALMLLENGNQWVIGECVYFFMCLIILNLKSKGGHRYFYGVQYPCLIADSARDTPHQLAGNAPFISHAFYCHCGLTA